MGSAFPELPELPEDDSMLSRKFGREVANYFSGSPLNRLSFLRTDHAFLRSAFSHPTARFLLVDDLAPCVHPGKPPKLAFATNAEITPLTGSDPFAKTEEDMIKEYDSTVTYPLIVFLGIDDKKKVSASTDGFVFKNYGGSPYFAVDISPRGTTAEKAKEIVEAAKAKGLTFHTDARSMSLLAGEGKKPRRIVSLRSLAKGGLTLAAAMYGAARALFEWNSRNPFCAQCGQPTVSVNAGTKRTCPPTDRAGGQLRDRLPCATRGAIANVSFPRTDPTIIVACVSADGSRMLLGRQKRWPKYWFSTLAGFMEPGESVEEAVRREVWEEAGVAVGRVVIHSSQPWPFPANLMIGAIAQTLPGEGETIHLEHDPELDTAKWFEFDEVRRALEVGVSALGEGPPAGYKEGDLRIPPRTAIANQLMTAVVNGYLGAVPKM